MGEGSVVGQILWGRKVQWAICNSNVHVNAMPERARQWEKERERDRGRENNLKNSSNNLILFSCGFERQLKAGMLTESEGSVQFSSSLGTLFCKNCTYFLK
jgi:hypothetical protein